MVELAFQGFLESIPDVDLAGSFNSRDSNVILSTIRIEVSDVNFVCCLPKQFTALYADLSSACAKNLRLLDACRCRELCCKYQGHCSQSVRLALLPEEPCIGGKWLPSHRLGFTMWTKNMTAAHPFLGLKIVPEIIAEMNEKGQTLSMSFKDAVDEVVVHPKPRHLVPAPSQTSAKPFRRLRGTTSLPPEREAGLEILDILLSKANSGSFTSHYIGSPPCRAGNPVIHDAHFSQKPVLSSPANSPHKSPLFRGAKGTFNSPSRGSKSFVRIEGFMPSNGESRQGIPAFA